MTLWFLYLSIQTIRSHDVLRPLDLTCTKRDYRLITDQSSYIFTSNNSSIIVRAELGRDANRISNLLTELWYEEIKEQTLLFRSSEYLLQINGELDGNHHHSWNFQLSSIINRSEGSLHIQSTTFNQHIGLLIRNEQNSCSSSGSPRDFALCCGLCSSKDSCPEIHINHKHSREDMIVTNRGLIFAPSDRSVVCFLFPSNETNRFWSTVTNAMNVGQTADQNDLAIVQHAHGILAKFFYYSSYPFDHWEKLHMNFEFFDVLFLPHRQLVLFHLKKSNGTISQLLLRSYEYKLDRILHIRDQVSNLEITIEESTSSSTYFHLYFSMLSNVLYLIGQQTIYASNNDGRQFTRVWTDVTSSNDSSILDPVMFSNTGHIAFIYRHDKQPACCHYFAVFTKAGLSHGWHTRTFRSMTLLAQPFFFDASGSFYFNSSPPLLIIQATEQSLVPTAHLAVNRLSGPFFVRESDMSRWFILCSLSSWDNRFGLTGSTVRFDQLGLFFVIKIDTSLSPFPFCFHVSRLTDEPLRISRQCSLTVHSTLDLQLSNCVFDLEDENSTVILSDFPTNIFLEKILNTTFAVGRIFEKVTLNKTQVNQWNLIRIQKVEQVLDRCSLKSFSHSSPRPTLINIPPASLYPIANDDPLITEQVHFLIQNDYRLVRETFGTQQYLLTSSFNHRKSVVHLEFPLSQLSCYLPSSRTITFLTQCLPDMRITIQFDRSSLSSVDPAVNLHWNRYLADLNSVIVYNLDDQKNSVCDGLKNCSCVSSWISFDRIHCAEQLFTMESTVDNRVSMKLYMENVKIYPLNNRSVFLIEEVSNRTDYKLIDNPSTNEVKEEVVRLFLKNLSQLTETERRIFQLLNRSLTKEKGLFFGPNLEIELLDEGLYHFRLTYLWGDQFCLSSRDLLILLMSNTATLTSYTFKYFLACIFVLISMFILWWISVLFNSKENHHRGRDNETFFKRRTPNDRINFEMLVKLRGHSQRLLPYSNLIERTEVSERKVNAIMTSPI